MCSNCNEMRKVLEEIQRLSNYPGKGNSRFAELALMRRQINKLASDALRNHPTSKPQP
jgi:nitrate/TMAO reductase-like tetraheme cytochrome c subunit